MVKVKLNVPLIKQMPELPTGCEITAVTMMLQYAGAKVNKINLAQEMPRDKTDANKGFVGDPFSEEGNTIYPPALMNLVTKYAGNAVDLTNRSIDELKSYFEKNHHPIVAWVGDFDGFHIHALVLTGFTENVVYYNDCWTGEKTKMPIKEFLSIWLIMGNRAISY